MKLDDVVLYNGINLMHVLYALKQSLDSRTVIQANQFKTVPFLSGLVILLLVGEAGGIFLRIIFGQPVSFLSEDWKMFSLIVIWTLWSRLLPVAIVRPLATFMTTAPWNLVLIIPHEIRRGLSLCSAVDYFRVLAKTQGHNQMIVPIVCGGLSAVFGGMFLFPALERNLLPYNTQPKNAPSIFADLHKKPAFIIPLVCALLYNIHVTYPGLIPLTHDQMQLVVVVMFVSLPIVQWLTKKPVVQVTKKSKKE